MSGTVRWALLVLLAVAFAGTVLVAGQRDAPSPTPGVERLGPESGEVVPDYLRRAAASLPPPEHGEPVWALVQPRDYLDTDAAADLVAGTRLSSVVLRVPLPQVQTALIFRELPGQRPAEELAAVLRSAAADRERAAAQAVASAGPGGRAAAVATVEAARLRDGCACVLGLLVRADGANLHELAGRPAVRAVHAASLDTSRQELAIAPLLPEQQDVVGPVADTGPVPPRPPS